MSWNYDRALERAQARYDQTASLVVTDVIREIDFDNISRTEPRRLAGTHLYADVSNFNQLLAAGDDDAAKDMLRLLHIFAREVSRIIRIDFDGCKVHFQGPRVHALAYRPVGDEAAMAAKAVLTALAIRHAAQAFNEVFDLSDAAAWKVAAGLDHGRCIATRNGASGDQELLFLGSPANHAAKILTPSGIRLTAAVRNLLPSSFAPYITTSQVDQDVWHVSLAADKTEELAETFGWTWWLDRTRARLEEAAERFPAGCVAVSGVSDKIDKEALAVSNTKRVFGVSIFADVDGFTGYIDSLAELDSDMIDAVRAFHVLRGAMRDTAVQDFEALRIQYQGDRMQALAYRPVDDEAKVAHSAVALAAALTSVADEVVPTVVAPAAAKRLAIGLAAGEVLVSKIGEHGHRDVINLGSSTAAAARIQQRLAGGEIGIDSALRELLPERLQEVFKWSAGARAWVATDLTYDDLMKLEQSENPKRALGLVLGSVTGVAAVGAAAFVRSRHQQPEEPLKPWHQG